MDFDGKKKKKKKNMVSFPVTGEAFPSTNPPEGRRQGRSEASGNLLLLSAAFRIARFEFSGVRARSELGTPRAGCGAVGSQRVKTKTAAHGGLP